MPGPHAGSAGRRAFRVETPRHRGRGDCHRSRRMGDGAALHRLADVERSRPRGPDRPRGRLRAPGYRRRRHDLLRVPATCRLTSLPRHYSTCSTFAPPQAPPCSQSVMPGFPHRFLPHFSQRYLTRFDRFIGSTGSSSTRPRSTPSLCRPRRRQPRAGRGAAARG